MTVFAVIALFLLLVALGFPVFVAMGVSGLAGAALLGHTDGLLQNAALSLYQTFSQFDLVAVPLYILVGTLMERSRLSEKLFAFARVWCGQLRGGLGVATIAACAMFAAISGSSVATAATIGVVAMPALNAGGYRPEFSGGMIAAGGTLGILIPPSIAMIVFGIITEQSIAALFISGVVPGLLLAAVFAVYVSLFARVEPDFVAMRLGERLRLSLKAAGAVLLPVFIFVAIYSGLATPTEVAALAVAYVLVFGLSTGSLTAGGIWEAGVVAARTTVMIFLLIGFGRIFTEFFTLTNVPQEATRLVTQSGWPAFVIVTLVIVVLLILGMFLESLSMMLVTVPILFPIMKALGVEPLAFGVFMVLAVEAALITPPVGMNLFTICTIGKVDFGRISKEIIPYVFMLVAMMYLVIYVPQLATWLPASMK
ncbi:MAG: TRAP transporter large permease [Hyphomicrobiaceae bacterium]|nr:MAG: TRAP transporter large permease [Hyphomicrobiaceae bacterium]